MDKKFQIFISSTYKDLIDQRNEVVKVVLRLSHLPVGMEIFNAASATPWDVITSHIDNSDYYVLILAHRYGSEDPETAIGYTEKEYDYALSKHIPCLAFVLQDGVQWNPEWMEQKPGPKKKLAAFKKKIHVHHVSYWTSSDDLASKVLLALVDETRNKPGIGWVRANAVTTSPAVAEEISRLSRENSELKEKLSLAESQHTDDTNNIIGYLPNQVFIIETRDSTKLKFNYENLFDSIAEHQSEPKVYKIINSLADESVFPNGLWSSVKNADFYRRPLGELVALGLITIDSSNRNPSNQNSDSRDELLLTELGQKVYAKRKFQVN
jgi:hypothetical protein